MRGDQIILAVDVGRGTQDIVVCDGDERPENWIQLVLPSRTVLLARAVEEATRASLQVVFRGVTMGGGPVTGAVRRHLDAGGRAFATPPAATTFSDDPTEVAEMGMTLVDDAEAERLSRSGALSLRTTDLDLDALAASLGAWGLGTRFTRAAVAVQDHGAAPPGESDRRFRFAGLRETLAREPRISRQAHDIAAVPPRFTRMAGVAETLAGFERGVVMDTGFAALLGACLDPVAAQARSRLMVNAGNGHTLGAFLEGLSVRSLFEHHTRRLTPDSFGALVEGLVEGRVDDEAVFADGGHGAWVGPGPFPGIRRVQLPTITGPQRERFSRLPPRFHQAAPFGSMMVAGCHGLLAAYFTRFPDEPAAASFLGRLGMGAP